MWVWRSISTQNLSLEMLPVPLSFIIIICLSASARVFDVAKWPLPPQLWPLSYRQKPAPYVGWGGLSTCHLLVLGAEALCLLSALGFKVNFCVTSMFLACLWEWPVAPGKERVQVPWWVWQALCPPDCLLLTVPLPTSEYMLLRSKNNLKLLFTLHFMSIFKSLHTI